MNKLNPLLGFISVKTGINGIIFLLKGTCNQQKKNSIGIMPSVGFFFLHVLMCKLDFMMNFVIFRNSGNEGSYPKLSWEKGRSL